MTDMILAIVFVIIAAIALFVCENKIVDWQEKVTRR